jgi:hypothetical protein
MTRVQTVAMKAAAVGLTLVSLTFTGAGMAGAASTGEWQHHNRHVTSVERHRNCRSEVARLTSATHRQQRFTSGTAAFVALETRATKAGNAKLATYWAHVVAKRNAFSSRQRARLIARFTRAVRAYGVVNGTCR